MRTLLSIAIVFISAAPVCAQEYSELWGKSGERWSPSSRLSDFSHAGYREGMAPIPSPEVVASVKDFGAVADDEADDTAAFKKAVETVKEGAIEIPAGRYIITDFIEIRKSGIVLRGAGPDKTTLYFPKPLHEVKPDMSATTSGRPTSNYSWSGGFITIRGALRESQIGAVTAAAPRGAMALEVKTTASLEPGQLVRVSQRDQSDNSLAAALYANDPGPTSKLNGGTRIGQVMRIVRVGEGKIEFDRPLRFPVELRWRPVLAHVNATVSECGVEGIRFEFPVTPYGGHFTEVGYNPLSMNGVANCWGRNLVVENADSGPFFGGIFNTIENIHYYSKRPGDGNKDQGHHGASFGGDSNLLTDFHFHCRFVHDITATAGANGNVISNGSGVDLSMDHHKRAPFANLWTNIDIGAGTRPWRSGGGADLGKHTAAWETFWNIRSERPVDFPPANFAPDMINVVGVRSDKPAIKDLNGKWFEPIAPGSIEPKNLHEGQVRLRTATVK